MSAKRKSVPAVAASTSADEADGKRLQSSRPVRFAKLSSAVVRASILSFLQLLELFEVSHVSAAFTEVSKQAAVDWMQRAFASTVQYRSMLARRAAGNKLHSLAAAAPFTFTLSDAHFVRSEMQRWGASGSLSARRLSEAEMLSHFQKFPYAKYVTRRAGGNRSAPSCSLHAVLEALFTRYGHAAAYWRWREKKVAKQRRLQALYPGVFQPQESKASAAVEKRWRSSSTGSALLLLLPDAVIGCAVLSYLDFSQVMDMRVISSSLKPACERQAALWMAATFPAGLATISQQQQQQARPVEASDDKQKGRRRRLKAAAAESAPSVSSASSSSSSSASSSFSSSASSSFLSPSPPPPAASRHSLQPPMSEGLQERSPQLPRPSPSRPRRARLQPAGRPLPPSQWLTARGCVVSWTVLSV